MGLGSIPKCEVALRLFRMGVKRKPTFRIVATKQKSGAMQGKYHEAVGTYHPRPNSRGEKLVQINAERVKYWLASGAKCSATVEKVLGRSGLLPMSPRTAASMYDPDGTLSYANPQSRTKAQTRETEKA